MTSTNPAQLSIGSTIYVYDGNYRVYAANNNGPIYREHWRPMEITGETSRSWITAWGEKVPKRGAHHGVAFTIKEVDDMCWMNDHRYKIEREVGRIRDSIKLREIAKIIGYDDRKP